jgi:hypothetical protein
MFKKCTLSIMKVSYNYKIRNPVFSISLITNSKKRGILMNRKESKNAEPNFGIPAKLLKTEKEEGEKEAFTSSRSEPRQTRPLP